jgi:Restriction endonuclease
MHEYRNLSPDDFERFVGDLFSQHLDIRLESFAAGPDKGIDLRHLGDGDQRLVIQCKHVPVGPFSSLRGKLKREVDKVRLLAPIDYRVVTSHTMSVAQKEEVHRLFSPYMTSPDHVYGCEDIESLLAKHPDVERRNFKLWLASTQVLQLILHNDLFVRAQGFEETIQKRMQLFVPSANFEDAADVLHRQRVVILAGEPGIGKTMLAEMLVLTAIDQGYQPVIVSDDVNEALDVFGQERKQIFYYDDFLGQTSSLEKLRKNEDSRLLDFIDQVRRSRDKLLVLTTREYILAKARQRYEKLSRADLEFAKCIVSLEGYSRLQRGRILYNHLYFSALSRWHKRAVLHDRNYLAITDHANYNPRIIETVSRLAVSQQVPAAEFVGYFLRSLDNPAEIWRHAFENQLAADERVLLLVLAGLPPGVEREDLARAYRALYAERQGRTPEPSALTSALRTLEGTFIDIIASGARRIVAFSNPSVRDFMLRYLDEAQDEFLKLIKASEFFDQTALLADYAGILDLGGEEGSDFPGMALAVSGQPDPVVSAFERTFGAPECAAATRRYRFVLPTERPTTSVEERMRLVLRALRRLGVDRIPDWVEVEVGALTAGLTSRTVNKNDALALVGDTKTEGSVFDEYTQGVRDWVTSELDIAADFAALVQLRALRPDLVTDEELEARKDEVFQVVTAELAEAIEYANDADSLVSQVSELVGVAEEFGFDPSDLYDDDEYERRLHELSGPDEDWEPDHGGAEPDPVPDAGAALDALFETLVDG